MMPLLAMKYYLQSSPGGEYGLRLADGLYGIKPTITMVSNFNVSCTVIVNNTNYANVMDTADMYEKLTLRTRRPITLQRQNSSCFMHKCTVNSMQNKEK